MAQAPALQPGAVFHGRYLVVQCMKAGAMGAVYEVVDQNTNGRRALKVMLPSIVSDADKRARFALEARVTGHIESDHLVRISDSGVDDATGSPFLVMELLRGQEIGQLLLDRKTLPADEVVGYLSQTARALDKTHAAGIVHRDLKPANLFVTIRDDGSPCVKILDFGIAKIVADDQAKKKTRSLGTPLYMSPEQIRGEGTISPRADLYSLGQVAYALLAGEAYWQEESKADASLYTMLTRIMAGAVEPASARARRRSGIALPPAFDAWFSKATAVQPAGRFERATDTISALASALGSHEPAPSATPPMSLRAAEQPPREAAAATNQASETMAVPEPPMAAVPAAATLQSAGGLPATWNAGYPAARGYPAAPGYPSATGEPVVQAGVAAPASRSPALILAIAGGVLAALAVVIGLTFLAGSSSRSASDTEASAERTAAREPEPPATTRASAAPSASASASASVAPSSSVPAPMACLPGYTCVPTEAADLTRVDAVEYLPHIKKLALGANPSARLSAISLAAAKNGTVDLSGAATITYSFNLDDALMFVTVRKEMTVLGRTAANAYALPVADPGCTMQAAWKTAVAAGVAADASAMFTYSHLREGKGVWTIGSGTRFVHIAGEDCASLDP